jgi:hypothetical protein
VVIRIRLSKENRQHNGQKIKFKGTNNDLQNIHIKLDRVTRTPLVVFVEHGLTRKCTYKAVFQLHIQDENNLIKYFRHIGEERIGHSVQRLFTATLKVSRVR